MNASPGRVWLPLLLAVAVLVAGWWLLWFRCDDAYIAFRYVANLRDGHGLCWNPAPWAPVEGYTSLLWVLALYAVWMVAGVAPPESCNPLALGCAIATLWLVARWLATLALPEHLARWRAALTTLVLCGIAGNHTFATWASSGLETAMFGLWAVGWTLQAAKPGAVADARGLAALATWATLAQLTRPDGALLGLATLAIAGQRLVTRALPWRSALAGLLPFTVPALHLVWRRCHYGEWLPNTYYAKVVQAWPESGLRYLYCFAIEHGLWLWLPLAVCWAVDAGRRTGALAGLLGARFPALVAVLGWLGMAGYYTLVVGGDHFAYRPFTHFVPLLLASALPMVAGLRRTAAVSMLAAVMAAGSGFGWWHERSLVGHEDEGYVRLGKQLPGPLRPLLARYDRCMAWLHVRKVCLPRIVHDRLCVVLLKHHPARATGLVAGARPGLRLVYLADSVGVIGWALADVAIIDGHGLNDWVVARTDRVSRDTNLDPAIVSASFPSFDLDSDGRLQASEIERFSFLLTSTGPGLWPAGWADLMLALGDLDGDDCLDLAELATCLAVLATPRYMAHERELPRGYLDDLRNNVSDAGGQRHVDPAVVPLTDDELRQVEARWRQQVRR